MDTALSEKLADYNGQFRGTLNLAALFFGDKTRNAIANSGLNNTPYWNADPAKTDAILVAMHAELMKGLPGGSLA